MNPSSGSWREAIARTVAPAARFYTLAVAALAAALLAGCAGGAEFQPAAGAGRYPPFAGEVAVLHALPAEGTFTRIGTLVARGMSIDTESSLVADLKATAAEHGADTIVLQANIKKSKTAEGAERQALAAWAIRRGR